MGIEGQKAMAIPATIPIVIIAGRAFLLSDSPVNSKDCSQSQKCF